MSECECLPRCPFFHDKMDAMPAMAEIYKKKYCLGSNAQCARHRVFAVHGSVAVPANLYPNDLEMAERVLAELAG